MSKFVITNRRARKFRDADKQDSRSALDNALATLGSNVRILSDTQPRDLTLRRVVLFEAEAAEIATKAQLLPEDVLLEPEILHWTDTVLPLDLRKVQRATVAEPFLVGFGADLSAEVTGGGQPLENAEVILVLQTWGKIQRTLAGHTDANGKVKFSFGWFFRPMALVVIPAGNFWSAVVRGPSDPVTIDCPALPAEGPLAWWHETLGITTFDSQRGGSIRVGVVDSGVGPHPCLDHVTTLGAYINGDFDAQGGADSGSHGSHVCGIIGARPVSAGHYGGISPGVELYSARVFPPDGGANQGDIALAIDELSRTNQVDLINMSLGADQGSKIELDAIQDALERGTLCVCAAGNANGAVSYPAAFSETVAISALGQLGWAPEGTLAAGKLPEEPDMYGDDGLYLANFSCYGPEVGATAPGVGFISTVPARYGLSTPYAAMDGTSMASPAACGALAILLSQDADYRAMPRDETRAEMARIILRRRCRDIGLDSDYQGRGVPDATT